MKPSSFIVACRSFGGLSAFLYVMSLLMPAFVLSGYRYFGFAVLIDGVLGVLFGFSVNWPWFANLALLAAWLFLICRAATAAAIFSAAALVAAVRFFAFPQVMNNEGGVAVEVTSLEPGCYLWLASIVFALAAAAARWRFNAARKASG
jgi:hypothetical protein